MRNSHNITLTNNDGLTEVEDTIWSLPGAVVGFYRGCARWQFRC